MTTPGSSMAERAQSLLIPAHFDDVLFDNSDGEEDIITDYLEIDVKEEDIDFEEVAVGVDYMGRVKPLVSKVEPANVGDAESDSESESPCDVKRSGRKSPAADFNLEPPELPRFRVVAEEPSAPEMRRGVTALRGRGRGGRGGRGRGGTGRAARSGWKRGDPLTQVYISDEELPEYLREEISLLLLGLGEKRQQRERRDRAKEDEKDDEELFFDAQEFVWQGTVGWEGRKETFLPEWTGPTRSYTIPYEAFRAYWDDDIISHIVTESNAYAESIQRDNFQRNWYPTNNDEIFVLFAFWIMLGIIRMPTIKACFSNHDILRTEVFRRLFTEQRYWNVNASFNLARGPSPANDQIHPIRPIVDHMNQRFKDLYQLEQNVRIDESLTLWKGPLAFKQYIRTKAARFGVKTYQLCESSTGYLWSFFITVGRATTDSPLASSASTVLRLIRPILNLGYVVFMDNFFNSPTLARYLKRNGTDCVGTLSAARENVPLAIQRCPLAEGEYLARHSGDLMLVALQDNKRLTYISTCHDLSQIQTAERPGQPSQYKLQLVQDYIRGMGGVDRLDQMLESYLVERQQRCKWTTKMFKRILNVTIQNARILVEKSVNLKIDSLAFRMTLVSQLMERHLGNVPHAIRRRPAATNPAPARLTERHFIRLTPVSEEARANAKHVYNLGRRRCVWCNRNPAPGRRGETKTRYECPTCNVALCLERCFEEYHTTP